MPDHPWVGRRVLARTPECYRGMPTLQEIFANIPRVEGGVITDIVETTSGVTVYVLIDGKQRPEPFSQAAIQILPERAPGSA